MNYDVLPVSFRCKCGAEHSCQIEKVVSGPRVLPSVPSLLQGIDRVLLITDGNTAPLAGDELSCILNASGIRVDPAHFATTELVVPNEEAIAFIKRNLSAQTGAIVGVGSGVISDLSKCVAHQAGIPYMIVATAPSMDGYASKGAAMVLDGMKVTVDARPPKWIVGDWSILASAPLPMLQSGLGDLIGKYSCLNDWRCAALILNEPFCEDLYRQVMAVANAAADDIEAVLARDEAAIGRLFEGLVEVGVAMSFAGNSRPASGSEHHLAHFYEIVGLQRDFPYLGHGVDVAYGTYLTCALRDRVRQALSEAVSFPDAPVLEDQRLPWQRIYGTMAGEVESLQRKVGYYAPENRRERRRQILDNRETLLNILKEAPSAREIAALLDRIGLPMALYNEYYGDKGAKVAMESLLWAKDLKDRYTLFNLAEDVGFSVSKDWVDKLIND